MTPYNKLKAHLDAHMYKRGQFQGDAPADHTNRGKNHFRVIRQGDTMAVRMYNTDLISVTKEDRITISMGGWWTNTTKQNLNEALRRFIGWGGVGSLSLFSYNQMTFRASGKTYRFYDGMEFDAEGRLLSPALPFERKRVDAEQTAEFRKDIEASGFKAVWPVLFATAEPQRGGWISRPLEQIVTQECYANEWAVVAANFKNKYDDHKTAYAAIVRECTRGMTEIVKTDVSEII